jgi:hypothetical protein
VDQVALLPIRIDAAPPQPAALLNLALRFQLTRDDALADAAWAAGVGVLIA